MDAKELTPEGMYKLGLASLDGGDSKSAAHWFREAAELGHSQAQVQLGLLYGGGNGVRFDLRQAHRWLRRAAALGDAEAFYWLGYYRHRLWGPRRPGGGGQVVSKGGGRRPSLRLVWLG